MMHDDLRETVPSMCPECSNPAAALIFEQDGKVYQQTECSTHGAIQHLLFSDSGFYRKLDTWNRLVFPPSGTPCVSARPGDGTGSCRSESENDPALAVIDITNRCNLCCPVCFAETDDRKKHYFLDPELVRQMLLSLLNRPVPCQRVQFSGGEPTMHPEFLRIVRIARDLGFTHVQVATNGNRFANPDYADLCEEAGLHTLYLQFDGMRDEVYLKLRGQRLLETKIAVVKNIVNTNLRIVLVPTIASTVNVDQIGPIFRFALEYSKHITGISFQPAALTGRIEIDGRLQQFDLAVMAKEFGQQTGLTHFPDDWFPLNAVSIITRTMSRIRHEEMATPACDAHCSLGTYFYIDPDNKPICITRFLDLEKLFGALVGIPPRTNGSALGRRISQLEELSQLSGYFEKNKAPQGLTFQRLLRGLDGWEDKSCGRGANWFRKGFNGMFVAGMHFMDFRCFNLRRLRRCIIQYVTTNGDLIPFCSYNSGVRHRVAEESRRLEGISVSPKTARWELASEGTSL